METLSEISSSASSPVISVEAPSYNYGNYAVHSERIKISPVAIKQFMYWHAGWEVTIVSSNFDLNVSTTFKEKRNLPLFLHNLSWEACNQVLAIDTLELFSSKQIDVITFHVKDATYIRTDFMSSLPIRHIHIECHEGRQFTVVVQLNLRHRMEYETLLRQASHQ
jgi:hypothetical protein